MQFEQVDVYIEKLQRSVRILEATSATQAMLVDYALSCSKGAVEEDPYGAVLWPAAVTVSHRLCDLDLKDKVILELGAGTGLVSFVATLLGARRVIASDYNPLTLESIQLASTLQSGGALSSQVLETLVFDVKDLSVPLPDADFVVIADLLYDKELGIAVARRVKEARDRNSKIIIGDSPNRLGRPYMLAELSSLGINCSFTFVDGMTVSGARHSLISTTPQRLPVSMGLLEL
jgi:predicted nicotinamide N-methyase